MKTIKFVGGVLDGITIKTRKHHQQYEIISQNYESKGETKTARYSYQKEKDETGAWIAVPDRII